jgi:dihydrofolate reductase
VSPKLNVFESISLDGYFTGENGDLSWAHAVPQDDEWNAWVAGNAQGGGALILGRVTYDMMVKWWPTDAAKQAMPKVAEGMNRMTKYVFSRTMKKAAWENTTILSGDIAVESKKLKAGDGPGLTILGSGQIVARLTEAGLIDSYQLVVVPVIIGKGRSLFEGVTKHRAMKLTAQRAFKNGNVVLDYRPAKS